MGLRELRRILQQIVLAGAPVMAAGCVEAVIDTDCVDTIDRTYTVEGPVDLQLQFDLDRCRADAGACTDLCQEMKERSSQSGALSRCRVKFGDASVQIDVSFEIRSDRSECFVDEPPVPEPTFSRPPPAPSQDGPERSGPAAGALGSQLQPQARCLSARAQDSLWNDGGRTCHA